MIAQLVLILSVLATLLFPQNLLAGTNWKIVKTSWSAADERAFSEFIQAIGDSGCNSVKSCLHSSANPYAASDSPDLNFTIDCAKLPYILRGYFAWKNGLPFSWVSTVIAAEGAGHDLRYSPKGNLPVHRRQVIQASEAKPVNGPAVLRGMLEEVNSAMYRYKPELDITQGLFFDFYPVKIDRADIRPGTIIYDPNGHVAMVYRVGADGRIKYFDAHTDGGSLTHSEYGEKFMRSSPGMGAGFKNFRPLVLTGAHRSADGAYVGGSIETIPFEQIHGYSTEQFYGNQPTPDLSWRKGLFVINDKSLNYYDYVRTRLAIGDLKYHPVEELKNSMDTLCNDLRDRVEAVNVAIAHGMNRQEQPDRLPANIYGTSGDWESYSSPSRDARLKTSFREIRTQTQNFVELYRAHDPKVVYQGTNLGADLRSAYSQSAGACVIEYARSDSSKVQLRYDDVARRMFLLDFDPYHCPELRWGASSQAELATCPDNSVKRAWYQAEQYLRNQLDRKYDARMDFDLNDLRAHAPGSGVATPPDVDLKSYLDSL